MQILRFYLALTLLTATGCYVDERTLHGRWQAAAFYENGRPLPAALDSVALSFLENGVYHFHSIGYYREDGYYRTSMHYLLLTDTSADPAREHILEIVNLSTDTLTLRMERGDAEQTLVLVRR